MENKETLSIDDWSSTCLECGRGAAPEEINHDTVLGYGVKRDEKGCGTKWKYLTSRYGNSVSNEYARKMRPDLEWIDYFNLPKS